MDAALQIISQFEYGLYLLLLVGALYYVRLYVDGLRAMRATLFGLEREHARARVARALSLLFLLFVVGVSVFLTSKLAARERQSVMVSVQSGVPTPAYGTLAPIEFPSPTATMDPALLLVGEGTPAPATAPPLTYGPLALSVDSTGCLNPAATLTHPANDSRVTSTVEVTGTAEIPEFAFYKFEVAGYSTGGNWITVSASDTPVVDGRLGIWDTGTLSPGLYAFRLVVVDRAGQSPLPCAVAVEVLARAVP